MQVLHGTDVKLECRFPGCNFSTAHRRSLQQYSQTHESDPLLRRPFACTFENCDFRAGTTSNLYAHIRVRHDPNRTKELACPLCSKMFHDRMAVKGHISFVHIRNEHKYPCDRCSFTTHDPRAFKRHFRVSHGEGEALKKKFKCEACDYCTSALGAPLEDSTY